MAIDLTGQPIAITGASSGIGRATALACAEAGMPVAVSARRLDRLESLVERIRAGGGRAIAVAGDVADPDDCRSLIDATTREFGGFYAVFANAGYGFEGAFHETPDETIRAIFETNFWGSVNTIRPAIERMLAQKRGHVLMCSSCLSKIGVPYLCAYSATKAAQDHFGRGLRHELRSSGIHVSTVHPIGTRTELFEELAKRSGGETRLSPKTPDRFMQPPETVARAVVRCLRRPRGEVWTSAPTRLLLGLVTAFPGLAEFALARRMKKKPSGRTGL